VSSIPRGHGTTNGARTVWRAAACAAVDMTIDRAFAPGFAEGNRDVLRSFRGEFLANDPPGYAGVSRALSGLHLTERLSEIECPTLLLAGEMDRLCPPSEAAATQARIPRARLEILRCVGHFSAIEAAEELLIASWHSLEALTRRNGLPMLGEEWAGGVPSISQNKNGMPETSIAFCFPNGRPASIVK